MKLKTYEQAQREWKQAFESTINSGQNGVGRFSPEVFNPNDEQSEVREAIRRVNRKTKSGTRLNKSDRKVLSFYADKDGYTEYFTDISLKALERIK